MSNLDTNRAIELIRQGNLAEGAKILAEVIQTSPNDEQAWLWMSACVPGQDKKVYCLQRVLQLNPNNQAARRGLETYGVSTPPAVPVNPEPPAVKKTEENTESRLSYRDLTAAMGERVDESKLNELTAEPEEEKIEIPENFSFENGPVIEEPAPVETQPYQPEEQPAYMPLDAPSYPAMDPLDMDALKEEASQIDIKPPAMERPADAGRAVMMEDFAFNSSSSDEADQLNTPIQEEAYLPPKPLRRRRKTNWLLVVVMALVVVLLLLLLALKVTGVI